MTFRILTPLVSFWNLAPPAGEYGTAGPECRRALSPETLLFFNGGSYFTFGDFDWGRRTLCDVRDLAPMGVFQFPRFGRARVGD